MGVDWSLREGEFEAMDEALIGHFGKVSCIFVILSWDHLLLPNLIVTKQNCVVSGVSVVVLGLR